jgi:hypothetical protein
MSLLFSFLVFEMKTIGVAMIVGGMAFLFSGLIFLLPTKRKFSPSNESFDESYEQIADYLRQIRKDRSQPVESMAPDERSKGLTL